MHLPLRLALLLPERAHVLLLVRNVPEDGHQLEALLLLVLLGGLRGPRLVRAEELGSLRASEVRAFLHFVKVKHKLELLVREVD